MTAAAAPPPVAGTTAPTRSLRRIGETWYAGYLFILPHFLLFLFMVGLPFFYNLYIALTDYTFGGEAQFVGLENFQNLANPDDYHFPVFWNGVWNTILFVLTSTPLLVGAGLGLAVLVDGKYRGRNFFRALFFAPWTLGIAVVGLLWWWLLNSQSGLLTLFLQGLGAQSVSWLTTNPLAWFSINVATLWWTVGFNTIILLAGLQAISPDLYEAASIDGATKWQQFKAVTIPSLRPILLLVITLQVIASFNMVGQSQIMTGGGPGNETRTALLYMYETGFTNGGQFQLGQAAAMGLIVAAMMVVVSIINFRVFRSDEA
ncbi:MAG TPA: sugar ABC transporter permease [Candidatus Limnocylindrales bacterium]|nr:sugar ABC transporter permease [Candidatus Limnocylindrales bacterium]